MTTELTYLAWTLVLALVYIGCRRSCGPSKRARPIMPARATTMGRRSGTITGRLQRAQKNLFETLPLFIGAVLIAHVGGRDGP